MEQKQIQIGQQNDEGEVAFFVIFHGRTDAQTHTHTHTTVTHTRTEHRTVVRSPFYSPLANFVRREQKERPS